MRAKIRKVVIPVAGLGTRVLPATKSIPKELLPVVDRPLIDYVVAEARDAGIEHIVLVTGRGKAAIEDYFDHAFELEATLKAPLGLGHAVWCARDIIGDEPFAVSLPDEIVPTRPGFLKQMVEAYEKVGGNLVAVEEVPRSETSKYGVIAPKARSGNLIEMTGMVEKPKPEAAPSNFRIIGRYVLQPSIFKVLETQGAGAGGEIQLTDALNRLNEQETFHACLCDGVIHDCGSKLGWLMANVDLGLKSGELGTAFADYVRNRMK